VGCLGAAHHLCPGPSEAAHFEAIMPVQIEAFLNAYAPKFICNTASRR
jgi:hypothetical protein